MKSRPSVIIACLVALVCIPHFVSSQIADDSREKREKVGDVLAALQAEPGKQIADVGAGEGFYSLLIARAVGPTGRVTAVDVNEKYLEKLRSTVQQEKLTNIDVVLGAAHDPRLPFNTFDAVLVYNAYHEMPQHETMLRAIYAGLRPGGRLVMAEPIHDNLRAATRAEQIKEHEISDKYAEQELRTAGFAIAEVRPDFLPFTSPGHKGGFWLIVATKPVP